MKKIMMLLSLLIISVASFSMKIDGNHIVDSTGNRIELKKYNRVVVMDPAVVEIFYLLGSEDQISAIANTVRNPIWPEEKTSHLKTVGTIIKPSLEQIISHTPDLVIINPMSIGLTKQLEERGLRYIVNEASTFDEILDITEIYGKLTGREAEAGKVVEKQRKTLERIEARVTAEPLGLKGAFLFSTSPMMVFNTNSLPGRVFEFLGIENIADGIPGGRPIISPEYLIESNPNILMGSMAIKSPRDIIATNPFVEATDAGRNKNLMVVDSNKILRASPRIIDAVEELYEELKEGNNNERKNI